MESILLCLQSFEQRRLVQAWLGAHYEIRTLDSPGDLDRPFDLAVVDPPSWEKLKPELEARKGAEAPVTLPVLLVAASLDDAPSGAAWGPTVDEVIRLPLQRLELAIRVQNLLQFRRLSRQVAGGQQPRQTAEALRAATDQLRALVQASPLAIISLDLAGRVMSWNPAAERLFGWREEEVMGSVLPTVPAEKQDELRSLIAQVRRGEFFTGIETVRLKRDGSAVQISISGAPLYDAAGQIVGSMGIIEDITARRQAEDDLKEANARLTALIETSPLAIISLDPDNRVMSWNPAAERIFGWTREEVLGKPLALVPPEMQERFRTRRARDLQGEGFEGMEWEVLKRDGSRIDIKLSAAPLFDAAGEVTGTIGVAEDITAHKQADEALIRAEEEWERTFNAVPDLIAILDRDHRIRRVNRAMAATLGMEPEELGGHLCYEVVHRLAEPPAFCPHSLLLADGQEHTAEIHEQGRDFLVTASPLVDHQGKPIGSVHVARDISERQRAEEAIRRQAELLDLAQDAIFVRDLKDRITFWNRGAEECYGWSREEALGKISHQLLHTEFPQPLEEIEKELLAAGRWEGELVHRTRDGQRLIVASRWALRREEPGQPTRILAINHDITQRKRAEAALQQARDELELRVAERTADLKATVEQLQIEVMERQRAEKQAKSIGRLYRLLSKVNEAIVRAPDQDTLFKQVCRIAVEEGLFRMAWVGLNDPDGRAVRAVSQYGFDEGYLEKLVIPLEDVPQSRGPTGIAVRQGRFDVCNDFASDPRIAPWRERALARGYRSSGAFPLRVGAQVVGALTLYAERPGFFNQEEIALLESLTADLSFAMESMDREAKRRRAEEALEAERQRLFAVLERIPAYVVLIGPDCTIPFANQEFVRRFGDPGERLCYEFLFGLEAPCEGCKALEVFKTNTPGIWEWAGPEGNTYQIYDYPFTDIDGSPLVLKMGVDITDRKRAEEALRESEERFAQFMRHLPGAALMRDTRGRYVFANETWEQVFGKKPHEWLGKTLEEVWPPDFAAHSRALDQEVFQSRQTIQGIETFPSPQGERHFLATRFPILDSAGNPILIGGIGIDITARQQAEAALREKTRVLDAFFAHSLTPLVILDKEFNFIRVNDAYARACEREAEEFAGRNHFELYPHQENQAIFAEVVRSKKPYQAIAKPFEFPDYPQWGVTYWDWTLVPILDEKGEVEFLLFSLRDVTARQRAEEALRESEQKLRFLTSQIFMVQEEERRRLSRELHDGLGQALLVFKLQMRAIERKLPANYAVLKDDCRNALRYIDEIIEDVRRLSRDLSPSVLEDIGLAAAIKNLCEEFGRFHELEVFLDLEEVEGKLSKEAQINLYRIVQESLSNISKYACATRIELAIKNLEGGMAFSLRDNGVGFPVEDTLARSGSDKGMGLAAMDERVRMLGGVLQVISEEGAGTTITFTIPRKK